MTWTRIAELPGVPRERVRERWEYERSCRRLTCEVEVTVGKALDVKALKNTSLAEIRDYAAFLRETAKRLYAPGAPRRLIAACPACGSAERAADAIAVFGQAYARCGECGHGFVREQPSEAALDAVFRESAQHSSVYVDRAGIETRLAQVTGPKADWAIAQYIRLCGRAPTTVLDVGAGGGHFVESMRRRGLAAEGYEKSRASRDFAAEAFGVALRDGDFLADPPQPRDIVTFWGLLEYLPEPRRFLEEARRRLDPEGGLLIAEVPRLDGLGTAAQRLAPDTIARHMDPTTHVNAFTDASLATVLVESGFAPAAVWYFGMDAYELLTQAALRLGDERVLDRLADWIPALQASLDQGRQCDDIVVAARPI